MRETSRQMKGRDSFQRSKEEEKANIRMQSRKWRGHSWKEFLAILSSSLPFPSVALPSFPSVASDGNKMYFYPFLFLVSSFFSSEHTGHVL